MTGEPFNARAAEALALLEKVLAEDLAGDIEQARATFEIAGDLVSEVAEISPTTSVEWRAYLEIVASLCLLSLPAGKLRVSSAHLAECVIEEFRRYGLVTPRGEDSLGVLAEVAKTADCVLLWRITRRLMQTLAAQRGAAH